MFYTSHHPEVHPLHPSPFNPTHTCLRRCFYHRKVLALLLFLAGSSIHTLGRQRRHLCHFRKRQKERFILHSCLLVFNLLLVLLLLLSSYCYCQTVCSSLSLVVCDNEGKISPLSFFVQNSANFQDPSVPVRISRHFCYF